MNRRRIVAGLFALVPGLALVPVEGGAATTGRVYRLGILARDRAELEGDAWAAFVSELARLGHVQGQNIALEGRISQNGVAGLEAAAAELVRARPDGILTLAGTPGALAAKKATATIPIIFRSSSDPVGLGIVSSLARPTGNITGVSIRSSDTIAKTLQYMAEAIPGLRKFAVIQQRGVRALPWYRDMADALLASGRALDIGIEFYDVAGLDEVERLLNNLIPKGLGGVIVLGGTESKPEQDERKQAALFLKHRVPAACDTHLGCLLNFSHSEQFASRTAARYVDRIIAGAKPSDLPVEQISTGNLSINISTAKALGLKIPEALLLRADEIIQ